MALTATVILRVMFGMIGTLCLTVAILYDPEVKAVREYLFGAWYKTESVVEEGRNLIARFMRTAFLFVESALDWLYGKKLLSLQTVSVFFCMAVASFGFRSFLSWIGPTENLIGRDHFPFFPFLEAIGIDVDSVPFFFGLCAFFLLLALSPGVLKTIEKQEKRSVLNSLFTVWCLFLVVAAFLFFEYMAHAAKPWPQIGRRIKVAAFVALSFTFAFAGLLLFLWLARLMLRLFQFSKSTLLLILSPLLYLVVGILLLLPSWSYWVAFWLQEHAPNTILGYAVTHYRNLIYFKWALALSAEMNLITASISLLVVAMSVLLLILKILTFTIPRSIGISYSALADINRGKIAVVGLAALAVAFPYYKELFSGFRELLK